MTTEAEAGGHGHKPKTPESPEADEAGRTLPWSLRAGRPCPPLILDSGPQNWDRISFHFKLPCVCSLVTATLGHPPQAQS